jgi:excisionase family DNA binding protein
MAESKTLTTQEVAAYLGVSYQRVNQLREKGDLPDPVDARPSYRKWDEATIHRWAARNWWDKKER